MLRQEKFVQQAVHLQQSLAVEPDGVALHRKEAPAPQGLERRGKTVGRLDAEFLFEVVAADMAELELQDEFPDEALVVIRRERAIDGQLALPDARDIRVEIVMVLVMRAADVPER